MNKQGELTGRRLTPVEKLGKNMCINPVKTHTGQEVACRHCWQCIKRKVDDWTGRCIAESQTAAITRSVTLTYGRDDKFGSADHIQAAVLTYSDFQTYIRSMRDAGYDVRYFVVGEYGARKGRAHWHAILYFYGVKLPLRPLEQNFDDEHWPHGHSYWQQVRSETVQYVTKYLVKEADSDERQYHHGLSKLPPLGDEWFKQLAARYVAQRLAPQDPYYSFEHVRDRHGRVRVFVMKDATLDNFLRYYTEQWQEAYADHCPASDLVEEWQDKQAVEGSPEAARAVLAMEKAGAMHLRSTVPVRPFTGTVKKPTLEELRSWMKPDRLHFSETLNVWYYEFDGGQAPWYWARDPNGVWAWRAKIGASHPTQKPGYKQAG